MKSLYSNTNNASAIDALRGRQTIVPLAVWYKRNQSKNGTSDNDKHVCTPMKIPPLFTPNGYTTTFARIQRHNTRVLVTVKSSNRAPIACLQNAATCCSTSPMAQ